MVEKDDKEKNAQTQTAEIQEAEELIDSILSAKEHSFMSLLRKLVLSRPDLSKVVNSVFEKTKTIKALYDQYPDDENLFFALHGFRVSKKLYTVVRSSYLVPVIVYHDKRLRSLMDSNDWRDFEEGVSISESQLNNYQEEQDIVEGSIYRGKKNGLSILETKLPVNYRTIKHEFQHILNDLFLSYIYASNESETLKFLQINDELTEENKLVLERRAISELKRRDANEMLARVAGEDSIEDWENYLIEAPQLYNFIDKILFSLSLDFYIKLAEKRVLGLQIDDDIYDEFEAFVNELSGKLKRQRKKILEKAVITIIILKKLSNAPNEILDLLMDKDISLWPEMVPAGEIEAYQERKAIEEKDLLEQKKEVEESSTEKAVNRALELIEKLFNLDLTKLFQVNLSLTEKRAQLSIMSNIIKSGSNTDGILASNDIISNFFSFISILKEKAYSIGRNTLQGKISEEEVLEFIKWLVQQKDVFQDFANSS